MAKKRAMLTPMNPPLAGTDATFLLTLSSMRSLTRVKLEIHEAKFQHDNDKGSDVPIGTLQGAALPGGKEGYTIALDVDGGVTKDIPQPDKKSKTRVIAIVLPKGNGQYIWKFFPIAKETEDPEELKRRNWFVYVKMIEPDATESNRVSLGVAPYAVEVGKSATYDWHAHNQIHLYAHGAEKLESDHDAAFTDMVAAIREAEHFVFITDWSFQPYFRVVRKPGENLPIGRLLIDQAKKHPSMVVGIIAWRHPPMGAVDEHNNNAHERFLGLTLNKKLPDNLLWRGAQRTVTYSHHQKFVVLDAKVPGSDRRVIKAFFGGLDLTKGRWDWNEHVIDPEDPDTATVEMLKKKQFVPVYGLISDDEKTYDDWYSAEFQDDSASDRDSPRQPWHDIYGAVTGPTAWDIVKEWVGRWNDETSLCSGDTALNMIGLPSAKTKLVNDLYDKLHKEKKDGKLLFVQQNEEPPTADADDTKFRWTCQFLRSMTRDYWETDRLKGYEADFKWTLDENYERSIQDSYLRAISMAEEHIYIETQYFISSGHDWATSRLGVHNQIAHAICDRIIERHQKKKPFHCYIICPMYPEGPPNMWQGVPQMQRHFEWETMQYMAGRIEKACGKPWQKYVSFYFPAKNGTPKTKDGKLLSPRGFWFIEKDGSLSYADPNQSYVFSPDTKRRKITRKELVRANNRYMVYVHSKLMMIDDTYAIFGSANLNERSLAGDRDTEVCVAMWPKYPKFVDACKKQLKAFRDHLFEEHFGSTGDPKSFGDDAQKAASANYEKYALGKLITKGKCMMLPFTLSWDGNDPVLRVKPLAGVPEWSNEYLFDADEEVEQWKWWSTKTWGRPTSGAMDLAE